MLLNNFCSPESYRNIIGLNTLGVKQSFQIVQQVVHVVIFGL